MRTALRKMGNSTGVIVPKAVLTELGAGIGAIFDVRVEDGRLVLSRADGLRAGWAEAAETLAEDDDAAEWRGFGNDDDARLEW
jgi:antitoxin MazE